MNPPETQMSKEQRLSDLNSALWRLASEAESYVGIGFDTGNESERLTSAIESAKAILSNEEHAEARPANPDGVAGVVRALEDLRRDANRFADALSGPSADLEPLLASIDRATKALAAIKR